MAVMENRNQSVLQSIKETLQETIPSGGRVLLFGSRARGEARTDSDWDILILIDKEKISHDDFDKYAFPLIELGWSIGTEITPLLYTYQDWQKRSFTPFFKNVEQEGIELWH